MTTLTLMALAGFIFGLLFLPWAGRRTASLDSPYAKAPTWRRVAAGLIDLGLVLGAEWVHAAAGASPALVLALLYVLFRDGLPGGRGLGKLLCGLWVVRLEDRKPCGLPHALRRNWFFAVPGLNLLALVFEANLALTDEKGMRLGDRLALTQVVEGKGLAELAASLQKVWLRRLMEVEEEEPLTELPHAGSGE